MNTAIVKKSSCLILCLLFLIILSTPVFARGEGNTEVIAHIEDAESSEIYSSEDSENKQSSISLDNIDSETVSTGDSSENYMIIFVLSVLSVVIILSVYRKNNN